MKSKDDHPTTPRPRRPGDYSTDSLDAAGDAPTMPAGLERPRLPSRYKLIAELGAGGMGAVYLAHDEVLGKRVALKRVRPGRHRDRVAEEALRREVVMAQRVTHPNVCRIYDLEVADAPDGAGAPTYLVKMEFVDGETLAERLDRGPLDEREAIRIGRAIASGLGAAHAQGVVHQDLKPQNVMLERGTGRVVLLDFGLARGESDDPDGSNRGVAGTPEYMAPEQARGQPIDARADLYALGAILYHVLAGEIPFPDARERFRRGDTGERKAPWLRSSRPAVARRLARVVRRLMDPDPAKRYPTARAVSQALAGPRVATAIAIGALVGAVLAIAAVATVRAGASHERAAWRPVIAPHLPRYDENSDGASISPDGRRIAFASERDESGASRLYLAPLVGGPSKQVTPSGRMSASYPRWSRDGKSLLFVDLVDQTGYRMPADGGPLERLAVDVQALEPCGDAVLVRRLAREGCPSCESLTLRRPDGSEREILRAAPGEWLVRPRCDAAGERVVYARHDATTTSDRSEVWLLSLAGGAPQRLTDDREDNAATPTFAADGRSVIYAATVDGKRNLWERALPASPSADTPRSRPRRLTFGDGPDSLPDASPDGKTLVYEVDPITYPLFAYPTDGTPRRRLDVIVEDVRSFAATPDGATLVLTVRREGRSLVTALPVAGGDERVIVEGAVSTLSLDGREVVYQPPLTRELRAVPLVGGASRKLGDLPGEPLVIDAGGDGRVHAQVKGASGIEAWSLPLAGGPATRDAPAPLCELVPAPTGGWRLGVDCTSLLGEARLVRPDAPLDDPGAVRLLGSPIHWDKDGRSVVYWRDGEIHRHGTDGSDTVLLHRPNTLEFALSPDGKTVYLTVAVSHVQRQLITNFDSRPR